MSYNYQTQYNSPNFTKGHVSREFIVIHWWDDPAKNPTYEGAISTLCNPARQASAHYVATGTGRRVACLVSPDDTAWHAGTSNPATNPNPKSIGIECDPRCRDEDYDVVAELIANIRSAYGDLPLRAHRDFVATRCPGNWDLGRLDSLARTKDGSADWGVVTDIKPPTPPQPPVTPDTTELDKLKQEVATLKGEITALKSDLVASESISEARRETLAIAQKDIALLNVQLDDLSDKLKACKDSSADNIPNVAKCNIISCVVDFIKKIGGRYGHRKN
jgi:uncharacterized coiled-coil protein SlyX